jgi:prepilin-type N-terminal cleavage/methylation domain-containing protein
MFKRMNVKGFSIIEIIMTLALLSLVSSLGCYGFIQIIPKYRLEGAVNSLVSDFHLARMRAIGQNCFYRIQVDSRQKQYFLERESLTGPSRWPGIQEGVLRKFNDPGNPYYYPGVDLESSSANPVFLPRGSVVGTTMVLKNSSGQKKITLSSQGRVKVQEG